MQWPGCSGFGITQLLVGDGVGVGVEDVGGGDV
jgi:hypothetical protein